MPSDRPVRRALLSVSDKTGLVDFAQSLARAGVELISTGGTAAVLRSAGVAVRDVADVTGVAEMMGGRVKTLHPKIHGAILARRGVDDAEIHSQGIEPIDLVVANLYPFEATIARADASPTEAVEMIDIGGPAMIRAAAKNFDAVTVVTDPADYPAVAAAVALGSVPLVLRRQLASKAFARTCDYDAAIVNWLTAEQPLPETYRPCFDRIAMLRYGENPHQRAALYREPPPASGTVVGARQIQGKPLSFNNLADADAALHAVSGYAQSSCVVLKHLNPCGIAVDKTPLAAYLRAFACDPTSAFGGIIAFNRTLDGATAKAILERQFVEVVVAPEVTDEACTVFAAKPNIRVLACGDLHGRPVRRDLRRLAGGLLVQDLDTVQPLPENATCVTRRQPSERERADLDIAWRAVQAVRSNAIVIVRDGATVGIGAGQMSRVLAVRIAGMKALEEGHDISGAVLSSDAFFPFRDNIDEAAKLGVRAIVQPGGSRRDAEVIAAADEHGMAMLFAHQRHFRH